MATQLVTVELTSDYGRFVMEPLERGFGNTIGNALRRVLLSSIYGVAVVAVRVAKVFHEFSTIPGAKEDMTEFLLNLKSVALMFDPDLPIQDEWVLRIDVKGPGRVTGADIVCPEGITVVNPEAYLVTLSESGSSFNAELYVNHGTGYTLPDRQERYKGVIGLIPTGSQFTPVRKVNYTVEPTRVGSRTDYDRLVLDIWTTGALAPNDSVTQAAQVLNKHIQLFFDLGRGHANLDILDGEEENQDYSNVPEIKIEELDFSQRTFNCLRRSGLLTLRDLAATSEADLSAIRGFGKKSLTEVRDRLSEHGFALRPSKAGYRPIDLLDDDEDFE